MNIAKKVTAFCLVLLLVFTCVPLTAYADNKDEVTRYSVLVLDTSGQARFTGSYGQEIYNADSAIDYVKASANSFLKSLLEANGNNYVAVVKYDEYAETVVNFTNNIDDVSKKVQELSKSEKNDRNISAGLSVAHELLNGVNDSATKNVILVTTGMTNIGEYNYDGHFNSETIGSHWRNSVTGIRIYAYTNVAYAKAEQLKEISTLYVLGLFQTMKDMPDEGKEIAQFFKMAASDLATSQDTFFEIDDPNNIGFYFGEVSDDITDNGLISKNVDDHINFIENSRNSIYNYKNSDIFKKVNDMAYLDDGVLAREAIILEKYWFNIFLSAGINVENDLKSMMQEISNSELVAQIIITEILSSDEFMKKIAHAEKIGSDIADEQLLMALKQNSSYFDVSENDKKQIEMLLNSSDKSSGEYISMRNELLNRYYSSEEIPSSLSDIVGLATDGKELLETFDKIAFKNAKHMIEPTESKIFKGVKYFNFFQSEVSEWISTREEIKTFYENVNILTSASYAIQETLLTLKENLMVSYYELGELRGIDISGEYVLDIVRYLAKLQNAFGDRYNDYWKQEGFDLIKNTLIDTGLFISGELISDALAKICPQAKVILMIPGMISDTALVLGSLLTNVDERKMERGYTLAMGMVFEALADAFNNNPKGYGYFVKKVMNDKTEYSVELYETGLCLYKKVAEMYERHAEKYLALLMDSKNLSGMAKNILLPEDYEEYKKLGIFDDKKKPVLSQLVVDSYSLNLWEMNISNLTCHNGNNNSNTYINPVTKKKYYLIACPVDINIVNNSTIIASVTNDTLSVLDNDPNVQISAFIGENSETLTKALLVPYDYDVEIKGYSEGKMSIQKIVIDNGNIIDYSSFDNIPVSYGVNYREVIEDNKLVAIEGLDKFEKVIYTTNIIDNPNDESSVEPSMESSIESSIEQNKESSIESSTEPSMESNIESSIHQTSGIDVPKTGNDNPLMLIIVLLTISTGLCCCVIKKSKRQ